MEDTKKKKEAIRPLTKRVGVWHDFRCVLSEPDLIMDAAINGIDLITGITKVYPYAPPTHTRQAMEYAKTEILNRSSHLKLLTTQGSLLSSLSLKEEVLEEVTSFNNVVFA